MLAGLQVQCHRAESGQPSDVSDDPNLRVR
jgi:hypothetical protein